MGRDESMVLDPIAFMKLNAPVFGAYMFKIVISC